MPMKILRLGLIVLLGAAQAGFAGDFGNDCPGATDVVMSRGACSENLVCELLEDGLPQLKVRSCTSGSDISALKSCFHSGDPCFYIHSAVYKASNQCASVSNPAGSDVLAASIPCKTF